MVKCLEKNNMDWLTNKINTLKRIGFFKNETANTVSERILKESKSSPLGSIQNYRTDDELIYILTTYDSKNVWFIEDASIIGPTSGSEKDFYTNLFEQIETFSNNIFLPKNLQIQECGYCEGRGKRLDVNFLFDNEQHNLNFCIDGRSLVISFLVELNEIIESTGYSFTSYTNKYCSMFFYFLSHEQKEMFNSIVSNTLDKGIENSSYWIDKALFNKNQDKRTVAYSCFQKAISQKKIKPYAISEFAEFLIQEDNILGAKDLWKHGITRLKNKRTISDLDNWWINYFGNRLKKQNH